MSAKSKRIEFGDIHTTIFGVTGSGKTYGALHSIKHEKEAVIFFNTKHDYKSVPKSFLVMGPENSYIQMKRAIVRGRKINFLPSRDERIRAKQLVNLIRFLFDSSNTVVYLMIDEVHLYKDKGAYYKLMEVATTGRTFGNNSSIRAVWMSQRPALIDNSLMSQSEKFIIFRCNLEHKYLKSYGFPVEEMGPKFREGGEFSYLEFDMLNLTGPYKV